MADKSDLPMLAVKRPLLVGVLNLLIVIAGLAAFAGIEVRELPNVDRPIVSVTASLAGAAPETMDSEVTSVLEDAVARVTGVRQINSSSEENNSRIRAEFNPGVDLDTAASDVREAVSRVTRDLPDRVEQVNIIKADADAQPIMILAVSSDRYGEAELTRVVENDVIPELLTAEGVASIDQFGTRALQMRVSVDPARLNRFGLTMSDVATALEGAPYDVPVGSFRSESQELVVRADASATDPDLIREVIVAGTTRVTAQLADWSERDRSQTAIVEALNDPLREIPGSRTNARGRGTLSFGGGGGGNIEVALTGGEYDNIFQSALALSEAIDTGSQILSNPDISYQPTQPQLSVQIDRQRASDLGVDLDDVAQSLRAMIGGDDIVDLNVGDQAVPIFLTSEAVAVTNPSDLRNLYVRTENGGLVPLSSITRIVEQGVAAELDRTEQRRAIELEANIAEGVPLQEAIDEIERLAAESVADDIDILLQGEAESLEETSNDVLMTYLFALVIVFLVLVAQFESLTSALVVLLTVPFALAAAILALFLSGVSLNIYSQIGLVMLIGLMAKNGILIVEFADQLRHQGRSVREAAEEAAAIRLRPIGMTLISTVIGAVPLILASGAGAEARQSIGWVILGGLGIAGAFTLFLTPVIYLGIARFGQPRSVDLARLQEEIEDVDEDTTMALA